MLNFLELAMKKLMTVSVFLNSIMILVAAKNGDWTMMGMHMVWCSSCTAYLLK